MSGRTVAHPVEIRDVLPTLLEAAGAPVPEPVEGRSLFGPMRNPAGPWRRWIDLEHDVCYSPQNHWNALTDGRRKYIFHAQTGAEQFFDLAVDPHELNDLAADTAYAGEVNMWRARLTASPFAANRGW